MTKWETVQVIFWNILGIGYIIWGLTELMYSEMDYSIVFGILNISIGSFIIYILHGTAVIYAVRKRFFKERIFVSAGHTNLNAIAELHDIRNQFHFWTTKKTKRRLIINAIRKRG